MRRIVLCVIGVWIGVLRLSAISMDSLPNWPAMGVPVINYTPETDWEFGAAAQVYFKLQQNERTSIVQVGGAYSLKHQWYANVQGTLYLGTDIPWLIQFRGGYRNYPDTYYGIGNQPNQSGSYARVGISYDSQRAYGYVQPLVSIGKGWSVGGHLECLWEKTHIQNADDTVTILMPAVGVTALFDTRDVVYYPNRGMFLKFAATHYNRAWAASTPLTRLHLDWRQFVPLGTGFVWCYQLRADMALSGDAASIPFQMLPTLGGQDLLRGIPYGMFRDNTLLAFQSELRIPIWRWIRACVFVGLGDVNDYSHWQWGRPKVGYGLGMRLTINRAKINIRADVARNNIYPNWGDIRGYGFYLTATEAF